MGEVGEGKKQEPAWSSHLYRDVSSCNTYNYGDAFYWDSRYTHEVGSFDWYQRYSALRPFVQKYVPTSARVLMVGCGNAVISEDMVSDGYEDIVNIDISSVVINMMKKKYESLPQLKCIPPFIFLILSCLLYGLKGLSLPKVCIRCIDLQMDVRDMSAFADESFDSVIDKGTLDSLMCGTSAPISASQMLGEVSRLLKPGGTYILITYGDPSVRVLHLNHPEYSWRITLYIIPRPGFQRPASSSSSPTSYMEPVPLTECGTLQPGFVLEDPDSHYIYICQKIDEPGIATSS